MNAKSIKTLTRNNIEVWQIDTPQADIQRLVRQYRQHPDIELVEPNYIYSIHATHTNDPDYGELWGIHNTGQNGGTSDVDIDAPEAWNITTGAPEAWNITTGSPSVVIAIIDTGIDWAHKDLAENIWQNLAEDFDGDGSVLEWNGSKWIFLTRHTRSGYSGRTRQQQHRYHRCSATSTTCCPKISRRPRLRHGR